MYISKVRIREFKTFDSFDLELRDGLNILAGDNDAGKSTVLEAMHLALTASYRGRSAAAAISPRRSSPSRFRRQGDKRGVVYRNQVLYRMSDL